MVTVINLQHDFATLLYTFVLSYSDLLSEGFSGIQ